MNSDPTEVVVSLPSLLVPQPNAMFFPEITP